MVVISCSGLVLCKNPRMKHGAKARRTRCGGGGPRSSLLCNVVLQRIFMMPLFCLQKAAVHRYTPVMAGIWHKEPHMQKLEKAGVSFEEAVAHVDVVSDGVNFVRCILDSGFVNFAVVSVRCFAVLERYTLWSCRPCKKLLRRLRTSKKRCWQQKKFCRSSGLKE